jgi:hypothetical protein
MSAVAPGSHLAITHPASDVNPAEAAEGARRYNSHVATRQTRRSRSETAAFFTGLSLIDPGVVQIHRWRPTDADPDQSREVSGWCGVARKP